jgi:Fe-S cluster assembly iron-binding protein IscA
MVTITQRAAEKIKELMAAENDPALTALRVAVEGGGCSGFQYALGFDAAADETTRPGTCTALLADASFSLPTRRARM